MRIRLPLTSLAVLSLAACTQPATKPEPPPAPVAVLPITAVAPGIEVDGPVPELEEPMKELYAAKFRP